VGLDLKWIELINRFALVPDLALFLDVPPEVVLKRLKRKRSVMETPQNQQRVREVYMRMVKNGRLVLVNGNKPVGDVSRDVLRVVLDFLERSHSLHN